jgi:hypothetical protein
MTKYQIINKETQEVLHESYTDFKSDDMDQLKHLLANTFWTPIFIVHMYLKNPDSIEIKVVKDEPKEQEAIQPKPKRTYKKKKINKEEIHHG